MNFPLTGAQVVQLTTKNVDMKQRRTINAGNAVSPQDYVTLSQLQSMLAALPSPTPATVVTNITGSPFTMQYVTVAGAIITVVPVSGGSDGQQLMVKVKQDGTGYTISWNSQFIGVSSATVPLTPNTVSWLTFAGSSLDSKWHLISSILGRVQ